MSALVPGANLKFGALALMLIAALLGCSKLSTENYDKLKMGMSFAEVRTLLGDPTRCDDLMTVRSCTWGDENRHVNVSFVADQVVLFNATNLR